MKGELYGAVGNSEGLRHGADGGHAHEIVDQLGRVTGAERAEIEDILALHVKNRLLLT
jgi:hypothetical protein